MLLLLLYIISYLVLNSLDILAQWYSWAHLDCRIFETNEIILVVWAAIRSRPLEDGEMPTFRCTATRITIPGALICSGPFEADEMTLAHSRQMRRPPSAEQVSSSMLLSQTIGGMGDAQTWLFFCTIVYHRTGRESLFIRPLHEFIGPLHEFLYFASPSTIWMLCRENKYYC